MHNVRGAEHAHTEICLRRCGTRVTIDTGDPSALVRSERLDAAPLRG